MSSQKILVTGGAGYIGSFTVRKLLKAGFEVVVVDSLENGYQKNIPPDQNCRLIVANIGNQKKMATILQNEKVDAVIHFAGYIVVAESMKKPAKYFENNIVKSKVLLDEVVKNKVKNFIFSSSAAVYGQPKRVPIKETDLTIPNNPYGETKFIFERMLHWYGEACGIKSVCLRYFNASGASLDGKYGEGHLPETHLIPRACLAALGEINNFEITCPKCQTPDGSTIRDYIHVLDLAIAHVAALNFLLQKKNSAVFNVGIGKGYSTLTVLKEIEKVSGFKFQLKWGKSRPGEPEALVADNQKICQTLGWQPKHSDLATIVETAWRWHQGHPKGE